MSILGDSENYSHFSLTDGAMLPFSNDNDKLQSILNVLRRHEEFTLSPDGTIISSNLEAVNITRYEEWEIIGKHFSILYSKEDILSEQPEKDLELARKNGRMTSDAWKLRKREVRFWARIKIHPLYDSLTTLRGYKLILRDATHKVFSDFRIQKVKNEFLSLYHNSILGIIRFDKNTGHMKLANSKALEIMGVADVNNFVFSDAFANAEEITRFNTFIDRQPYVNNFEFQLKHTSGIKRWASLDCKFDVFTSSIEGIIVDVTDKKHQEITLHKLSNDLETFIYHASHDLRAPLTSIMGLLNLMDMVDQSENRTEYASMIRERIYHLDSLLRDLSTIAFNNNSEINYERIFVREEIKFLLRDLTNNTKVEFELEVSADMPFVSDVIRFRTIIKNLISNSVKFYNQIEKNPSVKVTATLFKDKLEIVVEDNGIGIEKVELEKIYNMFHRGHSSRSGSGLGLYIVRSMIDQLGGEIHLSSALGEGTKAIIELPNNSK